MNTHQRAASAAVLCAALALGVTACGGSSSSKSATGGSSTAASASSSPTSASASVDPLAAMTGSAIVGKAEADLRAASSVRMTGSGTNAGTAFNVALDLAPGKGCDGTISTAGTGSFDIVVIGTKVWIKPDNAFWQKEGGSDAIALQLLQGKYLEDSTTSTGLGSLSSLCDLTKTLSDTTGDVTTAVKGPDTMFDGQKALTLLDPSKGGTMTVSDAAVPEVLQIHKVGSDAGTLNLTDFNAPVTLTPPPASETIDGSKYGL